MNDPLLIGLVIAVLVLALAVHEAAHAYVAFLCGDTTARDMGRMTLNPLVHIDLFLTIILPGLLIMAGMPPFGGAKPVPVNPARLRHPLRDMMWVALAGPASNVLQAMGFEVVRKWVLMEDFYDPKSLFVKVMVSGIQLNLILAVFNMFPIPPLDGSRVMNFLLPQSLRPAFQSFERFGMFIVFGLIFWVPEFRVLLFQGMAAAYEVVYWVTGGQWS